MALPPRVPSYCLHEPSGQAVVKVKGRSIYLGPHGTQESKERYARVVADVLAGREPATTGREVDARFVPRVTVAAVAGRYLRHADDYYRKDGQLTTEAGLIRDALRLVTDRHADLPADEFDVLALRVVRDAMVDSGLTRLSINKAVGRVVRCFHWAVTEKLYPGAALSELQALPGLRRGRTAAPRNRLLLRFPRSNDKLMPRLLKLSRRTTASHARQEALRANAT